MASEYRVNEQIRAREVRLIGSDGAQLGIKPLPQALTIARDSGLDLVEIAPTAQPPVCKILEYKKFLYEEQQKRKESRRKATNIIIKEMKFRPKIDQHDYATKVKHVQRFLQEGSKVKLTIMFRGREVAHPELGMRILERVAEEMKELAVVEATPKPDGRNITMVLAPARRAPTPSGGAGAPKGSGARSPGGEAKANGSGGDSEASAGPDAAVVTAT